jgi:integrase
MSDSTTSAPRVRKPRPDFPLWVHPSGRWCKKVRGRFHYFGYLRDDPQGEAALERWIAQRDDLQAGRCPRPAPDEITVADCCNVFLASKERLRDTGEISPRTYAEYYATCERVCRVFGKRRAVADLRALDFDALRADIAKAWGLVRLGNEITRVKSVFKFAFEAGLLASPVRVGPAFRKPSAAALRRHRAARGPRLFAPEELRALVQAADANLKAMLLLACNGGLGNTDVAALPLDTARSAVETGWLVYPRGKTGIERRIPLWDETRAALRAAIEARPRPRREADANICFIGHQGRGYACKGHVYEIGHALDRLKAAVGVNGKNRSFYSIRHSFQTIGEEAGDVVAVRAVMGHAAPAGDMSSIYRERVSDARLRAVVEHVRAWLFGSEGGQTDEQA